ncbi:MAG: hypothetical protein JSW48_12960 [Betaproteobacteria bacterium]|jgi:hypothetical protein|nr:MAG: hypothetical protein JSW48_12960 [Betaproteobacteria bacterium]
MPARILGAARGGSLRGYRESHGRDPEDAARVPGWNFEKRLDIGLMARERRRVTIEEFECIHDL